MSDKIAQAVSPLPESMRAGVTIVEYNDNGERHLLREGTNALICEPDGPADGRTAPTSCCRAGSSMASD